MARLAMSLCLVLTLLSAGSRPSTGIRTGSPGSSPWWDQGSRQLQYRALDLRKAGDYRAAEQLYQQGYEEARRRGDRIAEVRFLDSIAGCMLVRLEYRAALAKLLEARDLALAIGDRGDLGSIGVNLSTVYLQVWDLDAAFRAAEDGIAAIRDFPANYARTSLMLEMGRLHSVARDGRAGPYFAEAIEAARAQGDIATEAQARDLLGEERLVVSNAANRDPGDAKLDEEVNEEIEEAERDFSEAFRLRRLFDPAELGFSYGWLGAVKLARGELDAAERLTVEGLEAARRGAPSLPEFQLRHQRGRIRLARGDRAGALEDFAAALEAAARWRLQVLPARSSLTAANVALEQKVFRSYIDLASEEAARSGDRELAGRAFEAVEVNRAASLRESLALAEVWNAKLPVEYWEYRAQLGAIEARKGSREDDEKASNLALRLTEMEARAGIGFGSKKEENFWGQTSLIHFREGLSSDELLLSFSLGESESYLWAVSRESVQIYRLAGADRIAAGAGALRKAIERAGSRREPALAGSETKRLGVELYRLLFGQLTAEERSKRAWRLSLEGVLFDVPFAALVPEQKSGNTVYLVERHSLEAVPGALLLRASAGSGESGGEHRFVGVGDPIYNGADPRWRGSVRTGSAARHCNGWWAAARKSNRARAPGAMRRVRRRF